MKPCLATDVVDEKLKFPLIALPKIDGVRALNIDGHFSGRSLKGFANKHTMNLFSRMRYAGIDGELTCGQDTDALLCSATTSAVNTIEGEPILTWWVFDLCAESVKNKGYLDRYNMLKAWLDEQHLNGECEDLQIVPMVVVRSLEELKDLEEKWLDMGYEGYIVRSIDGTYKHGRSTVNQGLYLRGKAFIDDEATVVRIIEGQKNLNELEYNELGYAKRSSHQENQIPNGMVGSLECVDVKTGKTITVGAGNMTHEERLYYFNNQWAILGKIITYKHFPKGVKDKPRFPTFKHIRAAVDME